MPKAGVFTEKKMIKGGERGNEQKENKLFRQIKIYMIDR